MQWLSVHSQSCTTISQPSPRSILEPSSPSKETLYPFSNTLQFPSAPGPGNQNTYSFSMSVPVLGISYEWSRATHVLALLFLLATSNPPLLPAPTCLALSSLDGAVGGGRVTCYECYCCLFWWLRERCWGDAFTVSFNADTLESPTSEAGHCPTGPSHTCMWGGLPGECGHDCGEGEGGGEQASQEAPGGGARVCKRGCQPFRGQDRGPER